MVEELVEDGDEIVCLRVVDKDSKIASDPSVQQGIYKEEAHSLLEAVQKKNEDGKAISLVLELAVGRVPETIQRMVSKNHLHLLLISQTSIELYVVHSILTRKRQIQIYAPTCLIVGTRGRSLGGISGLLPGSVSKYCLQNSPVPVVVVRPEDKREKKKAKRLANPTRQGYSSILNSATAGGNAIAFDSLSGPQSAKEAKDDEAEAVAKAIGLKGIATSGGKEPDGAPLSRTAGMKTGVGTEASPSPTGPLIMDDEALEEVPEMEALGSPELSEAEVEEQKSKDVQEVKDSTVTEKHVDGLGSKGTGASDMEGKENEDQ